MKVSLWWKLACDESYVLMKVRIVKEVKRSDGLWRFACGDVFKEASKLRNKDDPESCVQFFSHLDLSEDTYWHLTWGAADIY